MSRIYLAYGSNISSDQMAARCRDAVPLGRATLRDWRLAFRTHATIEPSPGDEVPCALWRISARDERRLDLYEGFPRYYVKESVITDSEGLGEVEAMAYVMAEGFPERMPDERYLQVIAEGYEEFGLDLGAIDRALRECARTAGRRA